MKIIINDEAVETAKGENLLAAARRNASHIWFVCDGRGLCQTCECQVLSGAERLSPPGELERDAISDARRKKGYRLACQTQLQGEGEVRVLSAAEKWRRQATDIISPGEGKSAGESFSSLAGELTEFAIDLAGNAPRVAVRLLPRLAEAPPTLSSFRQYLDDAQRVVRRLFST